MFVVLKNRLSTINDKTFFEIYDRKNNSFDILRFILASLVIYTHTFPLLEGNGTLGDISSTLHKSYTKYF